MNTFQHILNGHWIHRITKGHWFKHEVLYQDEFYFDVVSGECDTCKMEQLGR